MKKVLYSIIVLTICIACTVNHSNKRNTLFGKYIYRDNNEKMELILNEDSTGVLIDNGDKKTFKWYVYQKTMDIEQSNDSALETCKYSFDGEFLTLSSTKYKKQ